MTAASFEGSDVDGLDRVAQDCTGAAQVVGDVKAVCEAIVAAASIFGPFGAAFIAYLKAVVIPWLTSIAEALQLFAKVLSMRSALQRDASSSATSLPTYTTPSNLPAADANDYPVMPTTGGTTSSYLWGLVTVKQNAAGDVTDLTLGASADWGADTTHVHLDYTAPGRISTISRRDDLRLGAADDPLLHVTGDGASVTSVQVGTPHLSNDADGTVTPTYDAQGRLTSITASGHENLTLNGIALIRSNGTVGESYHYDPSGAVDGVKDDLGGALALGPGKADGLKQTMLPAGVETVPDLPNAETATPTLHAAEATVQYSSWQGSFGAGQAYSLNAHTPQLTGGLGFGDKDGPAGGAVGTLGASAAANSFEGTYTAGGHTVSGVAGGVDVSAGYSGQFGGSYGGEQLGGYYTVGAGAKGGLGGSFYALDRDGVGYVGGSGEIAELDVKAGGNVPLSTTEH